MTKREDKMFKSYVKNKSAVQDVICAINSKRLAQREVFTWLLNHAEKDVLEKILSYKSGDDALIEDCKRKLSCKGISVGESAEFFSWRAYRNMSCVVKDIVVKDNRAYAKVELNGGYSIALLEPQDFVMKVSNPKLF